MTFRITGIDPDQFSHLYGLTEAQLGGLGVRRCIANEKPGFPDRIELRDAEKGETLLLLNYMHQPAATPYRASHAIFILEGAKQQFDRVNDVPEVLRVRQLSLRAFDDVGEMLDADLVDGLAIEPLIERLFANERTAYIQAHYAKRGCYAARIDRAG